MSAEEPSTRSRLTDPGRLLVGGGMALAGALFLAQPLVDPVALGGVRVAPFALSAVVLAVALDAGAVVFYRRGERTAALAHGVAGLGWSLVVSGPVLGSGAVLFLGLAVVVGGAVFLVFETRRYR